MQTTYSERTQKVENQGEVNWTGVLWFSLRSIKVGTVLQF